MRDLALLVLSALLVAGGAAAAWQAQEVRIGDRGELVSAVVADNRELRETIRPLRQRCPRRAKVQGLPFTPGSMI